MTLSIQTFPGGSLATNTYLVADSISHEAIVIDAADGTTGPVLSAVSGQGLVVKAIVLTHTHWDHIVDAADMQRQLAVPLYANAFAQTLFGSPDGPIAAPQLPDIEPFVPDRKLDEADDISIGEHTFTTLFVPGHEQAHIALWCESEAVLISGDVLFPGGHGTTEIPGSDQRIITQTLRRLGRLPAGTIVYPGHGDPTTIGAELHWIKALHS